MLHIDPLHTHTHTHYRFLEVVNNISFAYKHFIIKFCIRYKYRHNWVGIKIVGGLCLIVRDVPILTLYCMYRLLCYSHLLLSVIMLCSSWNSCCYLGSGKGTKKKKILNSLQLVKNSGCQYTIILSIYLGNKENILSIECKTGFQDRKWMWGPEWLVKWFRQIRDKKFEWLYPLSEPQLRNLHLS